ncbi:MAG: HAMP domain-containing sensor histidine kinase [Myxococcota bacterium]
MVSLNVTRRWWGPSPPPASPRTPPPAASDEGELATKLVAGVLHEVNTPLGALASTASTLWGVCRRMRSDGGSPREQDLELLERLVRVQSETADRLQTTMRALERFVDLDRSELRPVDLEESLDAVIAMLGAGPIVQCDVDAPPVLTSARALHRVLLHILEQALDGAGTSVQVQVQARELPGRQVRISVCDGGPARPGVSQLFHPRLTKTGSRVRLDLDWATTLRTVRSLGGEIAAESGDERGTTVTVTLPMDGGLR